MKIRIAGAVLLVLTLLTGLVQAQEQKVIFCAESISYRAGRLQMMTADRCLGLCAEHSQTGCLENMTKAGWQITSTSPKTVPEWNTQDGASCSCIGIQYALKMDASKPVVTEPLSVASTQMALLEKEIELLKKENGMLQKEVAELKRKRVIDPKK